MELARPSRTDALWLAVALTFLSASGPIIAATAAPALAIAFWRCAIGSGVTGIWVLARQRVELRRLNRREMRLIVSAGVLLGLHFATWVPSLRFTSVAASTALVATQPVWAALIARARGVHIAPTAWLGIGIALAGVLVLTGIDVSLDPRHLIGDGLALLGAMFSAAYVSVGEHARKSVSTSTMTFILYGVSALTVLVVVVLLRVPLVGFSAQAWALIPAAALIILGLVLVIRSTRSSELVESPPV